MTKKALNIIILLITLAAVSTLYLHYTTGITVLQAITDSVISTMLLTGFSGGLLQLCRFVKFELDGLIKFIVIHLIAGIIVSVFWVIASKLIIFNLLISDAAYQSFFQKNFITRFFIGLILYFTFTAFIYLIQAYFKNIENIKNQEALKTKLLESELNMMKLQINPHFIFNSLNSISALTHIDPKLSVVMTEKLAGFIRLALASHDRELIPLHEEIENIKRYLDIEQVRFDDKMIVKISTSKDSEMVPVPSYILVPVLENAIKHGVQPSTVPVEIDINAELIDEMLKIEIRNGLDGVQAAKKTGLGVGLQNVRDRIRLHFRDNGSFTVLKKENSYTATILIPVENR
ncbi:MAG: histidine kinase [Bacteroidetes bacterium]|nr:histidine kinase [Bacteroidota bacterium]